MAKVTKKAVRKTEKKVTKKVTKKATKKVSKKALVKKSTKKLTEEQKKQKDLDKQFNAATIKGVLEVAVTSDDSVIIRKVSGQDPRINDIFNQLLRAYETSLRANELASIFDRLNK